MTMAQMPSPYRAIQGFERNGVIEFYVVNVDQGCCITALRSRTHAEQVARYMNRDIHAKWMERARLKGQRA